MKKSKYPDKLIIEPTTRCNFKCEMCVKQSQGCEIAEGDLDASVFLKCENLIARASTVIFTGIGEPLLHRGLESYLSSARKIMPEKTIRGFQTNGKLLTSRRAELLIKAGMNKICISVDSVLPGRFDLVRQGGMLSDVETAFDSLKSAIKNMPGENIDVGIEFVLMKKNMHELPQVVEWAAKKGVNFIIVTHLSAYEKGLEKEIVYMNNSYEALELFKSYQDKAIEKGLDIRNYDKARWKFGKSQREIAVYDLVAQFKQEALNKDLYVNMFHLLSEKSWEYDKIRENFNLAESKAKQTGIDLSLPQIRPKTERYCPFVEEKTMFVAWDGNVSPCYFLWHKYTAIRMGYAKQVTPVFFGNVHETPAEQSWQGEEFTSFREKVMQYDYPNCHAWCETRCDYVLEEPFYQDCYINDIPCCDCFWGLGLLNCLT